MRRSKLPDGHAVNLLEILETSELLGEQKSTRAYRYLWGDGFPTFPTSVDACVDLANALLRVATA